MKACCKNCKHLRVPANASGRRVVRKGNAYPCTAPTPPNPVVPESVYAHRSYMALSQAPRRMMEGDEGVLCPLFEGRKK